MIFSHDSWILLKLYLYGLDRVVSVEMVLLVGLYFLQFTLVECGPNPIHFSKQKKNRIFFLGPNVFFEVEKKIGYSFDAEN